MKRKRILLADNDKQFLQQRAQLLREEGYEVVEAPSLHHAQCALQETDFDLAILDLRLEDDTKEDDISGLKLAETASPLLPKIIMSNFGTKFDVRRALRIGPEGLPPAVDFVDKGGGIEALKPAIRRALGSDLAWLRTIRKTDEDLEMDYTKAQEQAALMYRLSLIFISLGSLFLFLSLGVIIFYLQQRQADSSLIAPAAGLVTAIGGVIGQVGGVLFFRRVDAANSRIEHYHDERLSSQRFEVLLNACENLEERSEEGRMKVIEAAASHWLGSCGGSAENVNGGSK